jgi:hypothetical protein
MNPAERDPQTPEADALEQEADVAGAENDDDVVPEPSDDPEAPEADALEQAQPVPMDEDEEPR